MRRRSSHKESAAAAGPVADSAASRGRAGFRTPHGPVRQRAGCRHYERRWALSPSKNRRYATPSPAKTLDQPHFERVFAQIDLILCNIFVFMVSFVTRPLESARYCSRSTKCGARRGGGRGDSLTPCRAQLNVDGAADTGPREAEVVGLRGHFGAEGNPHKPGSERPSRPGARREASDAR